MKAIKITYWATTISFALMMTMSAITQLTMQPKMIDGFKAMGYPVQLMLLLGVFKALGVIAIVYPGFKGIKEWAYAGFTFLLIGATFSHFNVGDFTPIPLVMLTVLSLSYITHKRKDTAKKPIYQTI